jgi:hypothetical protein
VGDDRKDRRNDEQQERGNGADDIDGPARAGIVASRRKELNAFLTLGAG